MKNAVAALRRANLAQVVVPVGGQHHAILGQQNMNALGVTQINAFALEFLNFLAANDFVGGASGMNRPAVLENHLEQMLGNVPPVSYTHLDVYKRQVWSPNERVMLATTNDAGTVISAVVVFHVFGKSHPAVPSLFLLN